MLIYLAIIALTIVLSAWKGDLPERLGGLTIAAMLGVQLGIRTMLPVTYETADPAVFCADLFGLVAFAMIAHFGNRSWPFIAAALQLASVLGNVARGISVNIEPKAYYILKGTPTFVATVIILFATIMTIWNRRETARAQAGREEGNLTA